MLKSKHSRGLVLAGFLLLFALLISGARRTSLTADEPTYIALGYALLARGAAAFPLLPQRGYPPLLIALEAWPLYTAVPGIPLEQLAGWPDNFAAFTEAFKPYLLASPAMTLLARLPVIWLTLILSAVVSRWAKALWRSAGAGLLALGVLLFDPLLLGHGRLANSDAGTVALGTAALYAAWRWQQKPTWRRALGFGALSGLTLLAKASGPLWIAAGGLMLLTALLRRRHEGRNAVQWGQAAAAGALSLLLLWAGYGFEWGPLPDLPFPVPAPTHWRNLLYLDRYTDIYFALGVRQTAGWWWYFPLAFLIKNPLPLLIGLGIGGVALRRFLRSGAGFTTLLFFPLLYTVTAILEGLNLGYRFMLPLHPFFYLIIAGGLTGGSAEKRSALRPWILGGLGLWYAASTLHVFPYEIAYFNELVGGPQGGYRYLADSNVDWGQAHPVWQAYVDAHPDVQVDPPAARFHPAPGRYIVGASYLNGIGLSQPEAYEWFRHREPQAVLAYSQLVYDGPSERLEWVAQCEQPAPPLDAAAIAEGTGQPGLRQVTFDCTRAWLYPAGGYSTGIYALHQRLFQEPRTCWPTLLPCPPAAADPFVARQLASLRFSYAQTDYRELPAFALYESPAAPEPSRGGTPATLYAVAAGTPFANLETAPPLTAPAALEGPLALQGVYAYAKDGALELETWWRVIAPTDGRAFSVMAHLLAADGTTLEVADGLGLSPAALAVGDVLVQRHRFAQPPAGTRVALLTGAYWQEPLERWPVTAVPGADSLLAVWDSTRAHK